MKNEWYPSFEVADGLGKSIPELLPHKGPYCVSETTRGIKVTASWLYAPDTFREGWVYKIGITVTDAFELEQAQLVTRHWRIKDFNGEESAVDGPGVVGFTPL